MDKRLKFIRSKNPFEGLEDYKSSPCLEVKESSISYPIQSSFFPEYKNVSDDKGFGLRTKEGHIFELIAHSVHGGSVKSLYHNGTNNKSMITSEPDISDKERGILREIKSVSPGNSLKLRDTQIAKYVLLQTSNFFKNPPRIMFDIFRHGVRGMQDKYKDKGLEELIKDLSGTIKFSLTLPFSVIFEIYSQKNDSNYRYDGPYYDSLTGLNSSALNNFVAYPEDVLSKFNLNPDDFDIEKKRFPSTSRINGFQINPFPMVFIQDKNYSKFISNLASKINSDTVLSERLYSFTKGMVGNSDNQEIILEDEYSLWGKSEDAPF